MKKSKYIYIIYGVICCYIGRFCFYMPCFRSIPVRILEYLHEDTEVSPRGY